MTTKGDIEPKARPHLRLIVDNQTDESDKHDDVSEGSRQLMLPFPDSRSFFFVYIGAMDTDGFRAIIDFCMASWVIDVRAVPRFDIIATSRRSAFELFQRADARYVDLFGRLGIHSYDADESNPSRWGVAVLNLLKDAKRLGPYVFLFDDEKLMRDAHRILPDIIRPFAGKEAHFESTRD